MSVLSSILYILADFILILFLLVPIYRTVKFKKISFEGLMSGIIAMVVSVLFLVAPILSITSHINGTPFTAGDIADSCLCIFAAFLLFCAGAYLVIFFHHYGKNHVSMVEHTQKTKNHDKPKK